MASSGAPGSMGMGTSMTVSAMQAGMPTGPMVSGVAAETQGGMPSGGMLDAGAVGMPTMQQRAQIGTMPDATLSMAASAPRMGSAGVMGTAEPNGAQGAMFQSPGRPRGVS